MKLLREVAGEIAAMFAGDAGLSLAILAIVAGSAGAIEWGRLDPLIGGAALLLGCLLALFLSVLRAAARAR